MNLNIRVVLLLLLGIVINTRISAQSIANYSTARTTGITYSSISATGNAIDSWRNNTVLPQDDNRSNATDIGFDFWYNGIRYSKFSVSTNGYIDFSSSTADGGPSATPYGYDNAQFTGNGSGTWLALAPFYDDMTAQGGTDALGNSIKYLVSGTAPNRVLTIEWINMAVYLNTSPSLNFQVKLYETTGAIDFIYGTMTQGTAAFTYTCGINAATLANAPTAAQLKSQQTANTNTFNNGQQNSLTAMPTSNSRIRFTPPTTTPATPSGALTFTGVTQTSMNLNWTNWCTNEVGYVVYNSTDNVNFSFVAQTALNATTYAATALLPSTTYYWRVMQLLMVI
ncbi:MAG: fibronectin type III domain-containing protein [Bacteroidetes bacterium]|nr:fibronectin type III domain-containing protein [Bacteroidota bacterium]